NQCLFIRKSEATGGFKMIKGTERQVSSPQQVHQTIFCGHNSGTFVIRGDQAELVSDFRGSGGVKAIEQHDDLVLQGNYNGLSVLTKTNGQGFLRNVIEGFNTSSRSFEINDLDVVVNHEQTGLFHLVLDTTFHNVVKVDNVPAISHSSNIFQFQGQLYYKTFTGIYSIGDRLTDISLDSIMTAIVFKENQKPISIIIPD